MGRVVQGGSRITAPNSAPARTDRSKSRETPALSRISCSFAGIRPIWRGAQASPDLPSAAAAAPVIVVLAVRDGLIARLVPRGDRLEQESAEQFAPNAIFQLVDGFGTGVVG